MKKHYLIPAAIIMIILLLIAVLVPESSAQTGNSQEFTPSRYAVIAAEVSVFSPQTINQGFGSDKQNVIVKLDTVTGRTWILQLDVAGNNDPKIRHSFWRELGSAHR